MKKAFAFTLAVAVLLSCCFLGGCIKKDVTEETTAVLETEAAPEPIPYPVIVNGTTVSESPESIISLSPSLTEIICEMGYIDRIRGRGAYCDFPSEITSVSVAGSATEPDIDAISAVKPQLVITSTPIASKDKFLLEQGGISVLVIPVPATIEEFRSVYRALGIVFEGSFTGSEKGDECFSAISKALDNTKVVSLGKFVYITENLACATGDTLENAVLSCFGSNLAESAEDYSFDKSLLLQNQPDVILLSGRYTIEDLLLDEVYSQLDAVKSNRIISLDNTYFERPSARITELTDKLCLDFEQLSF